MTAVESSLRTARERGERPSAQSANLRNANLRGANLRGANLRYANLRYADLRNAELRGADLRGANLRGANLRYANLRYADLRGADLWEAGAVGLGETPSGNVILYPTPDGWRMQVGCWRGSPDDLRTLIAQDEGWPEAEGDEILRRRPHLEAVLVRADLITAEKAHLIADLAEKWADK